MSIETTLRTYLLTDATLTSLISTRLYYALAPQEVIKPYVVYYTLDDPLLRTTLLNTINSVETTLFKKNVFTTNFGLGISNLV